MSSFLLVPLHLVLVTDNLHSAGCICLYLIFAVHCNGNVCTFPIRCRSLRGISLRFKNSDPLGPTVTIFFFTSILLTYLSGGKFSPCL